MLWLAAGPLTRRKVAPCYPPLQMVILHSPDISNVLYLIFNVIHIIRALSFKKNGSGCQHESGHPPSSPGEFHPQALTDPDVTVSRHPALIISPLIIKRLCLTPWLLPSLVDQTVRPDDPTPSLHPHYRDFNTTTSWSAPVPRIGTLTLMGPPLEFLPYHRDDRFPRSAQEPGSGSRHLYAGRHPGSKQVSPGLILGVWKAPSFDVI